MKEADWVKHRNFKPHVEYCFQQNALRKLRLFSIACARQLLPWATEPLLQEAMLRAEQFADGELAGSTLQKWYEKLSQLERTSVNKEGSPQNSCIFNFRVICLPSHYPSFADNWRTLVAPGDVYGKEFAKRGPRLADTLLRDIFGNPFRPVAFDPAWRTSTAIGVASQMYDSRHFNAMPILADALQDAGCEDDTILSHCRDVKQVHVRGCWVVDLTLGKK